MTSVPKRRLAALSQQLVEGIPSEGTFENLPRIRHVAGPSTGQRVQGKVAIVTGTSVTIFTLSLSYLHFALCALASSPRQTLPNNDKHYRKEN